MAFWNLEITVGTPVLFTPPGGVSPLLTLRATPGNGGTLLVEYRISPTGAFTAWPAGTVSAATVYILNGPVEALRFTAAGANGTVEVAQ